MRNRIGDDELRQLFENFGQVQSCIVNQDKRHAFIKMLTREDAVKAKAGMETYKTDNMTLRV
jgi:protein NRD1